MGNTPTVLQTKVLYNLDKLPDAKNAQKPYQFVVNGQTMKKFKTLSKLGHYKHGSVYLVQDVYSKQRYALKIIEKCTHPEQVNAAFNIMRDAITMAEVYEGYQWKSSTEDILFIVLVRFFLYSNKQCYYEQGNLETYLERAIKHDYPIPWKIVSVVAYDVAQGLHYLHSLGVSHRQLSLTNILIKLGNEMKIDDVVLSDFATVATTETSTEKEQNLFGTRIRKYITSRYLVTRSRSFRVDDFISHDAAYRNQRRKIRNRYSQRYASTNAKYGIVPTRSNRVHFENATTRSNQETYITRGFSILYLKYASR
jgi:serine/threonine protein kinase